MEKLFAFLILSACVIFISRGSLRVPRSHGFYRFFAWEFILALVLLNLDAWFADPWSWHQIISWLLLLTSLFPLGLGVSTLIKQGKSTGKRIGEPQLLAFEKTSTLVTSGIYHYIRHPMYSSLLLFAWGAYFKAPLSLGILLVVGATWALFATARADEAECVRFFGVPYLEYMIKTRRFIPYLF